MERSLPFAEVLEERLNLLSPEEQETLVDIVHRRMAERGRKRLAAEVQVNTPRVRGRRCPPSSADELMNEILP